jgi:phosphatidylinositol alpha-1,6-mannosyltransferase
LNLKALFFTPAYPDSKDRTKQNHLHNALLSFNAVDIQPVVVDLTPRTKGIRSEIFEGIQVIRFGIYPKGIFRSFLFRALFRYRMTEFLRPIIGAYDIVHLNTTMVQMHQPLKSLGRRPVIATCHGNEVFPSRSRTVEAGRRNILNSCDAVTAVSDYTACLVRGYVGTSVPVFTIPNGVRSDIFRRSLKKNKMALRILHNIGRDRYVILMACAMIDRKGVLEVLDSFELVARKCPKAFLVCIGNGNLLRVFSERIIEKGLTSNVRVIPYVDSDQDMADFYRLSDLYIMLSKTVPTPFGAGVEGFGISYIDAGAVGIPVIGGKSGGVQSAVIDGETGFLFDPDSPTLVRSVANKIIELISDPCLAATVGRAGKARVWNELTWERYALQIRTVYESVLKRHGKLF